MPNSFGIWNRFLMYSQNLRYEQPYNPKRPVICFDERPCQLLNYVLQPLPMESGKVIKEDYHYQRNGTCCVFMAVEPLAGRRVIKVTQRKTKRDYALVMKELSEKYPEAEKIILVQDNLNIAHSKQSVTFCS